MMVRYAVLAGLVFSQLLAISVAMAASTSMLMRREIRQMPILERPSRPGHFYGNTVRRRHARKSQIPLGDPWSDYVDRPRDNPWEDGVPTGNTWTDGAY